MIFGFVMLVTALIISLVAEYYSIMGLVAIFAAAFVPVIVMGASLGLGKIVATVWLHNNWSRVPVLFKMYLIPAITFLMILTSIGVFGFLSKAHLEQATLTGDAQAQVQLFDDKILTEKDNIESARQSLKQMDATVNLTMDRGTNVGSVQSAANLRRRQTKERTELQVGISVAQKNIATLQEQRAPLAMQSRKIEAEVGPVKYIAALVYGDNPDSNLLERAVRWVIILIVVVFDPLALCLILAANLQFTWARQGKGGLVHDEVVVDKEDFDTPLSEAIAQLVPEEDILSDNVFIPHDSEAVLLPKDAVPTEEINEALAEALAISEVAMDAAMQALAEEVTQVEEAMTPVEEVIELALVEEIVEPIPEVIEPALVLELVSDDMYDTPEVLTPFPIIDEILPVVELVVVEEPTVIDVIPEPVIIEVIPEEPVPAVIEEVVLPEVALPKMVEVVTEYTDPNTRIKSFIHSWVAESEVNFMPIADNDEPNIVKSDFGTVYPTDAKKGDMYLRVDYLPAKLFKHNGVKWMEVDKASTDSYSFNEEYIKYVIERLNSGEYSVDELTDSEQDQIAEYLNKSK